jgi:acetylornithine deacetylase/succinyl-diaminopimelate desuccinylase-like protein
LYAHVKAVESVLAVNGSLPINVKLLFEGEEEIASPSLEALLVGNRALVDADLMYSSDGATTFEGKPAILFGVRGVLKIEIFARGGSQDTHSGMYGGLVPNPVWALVHLLKTMRDEDGRVLIDGFYEDVLAPSPSEREAMERIGFDERAFCREHGLKAVDRGPGDHPLERVMFWPTFNIQGFFAGASEAEGMNIIPATARTVIDVRLVANQRPEKVLEKVKAHVDKMAHLGEFHVTRKTQMAPFRSSLDHPYAPAVSEAVRRGFEAEPVLIPSMGWSDPTHLFGDLLGLPCFKVPYAQADSNFHAPNENLLLDVYEKSIRTTAALFFTLAGSAGTDREI